MCELYDELLFSRDSGDSNRAAYGTHARRGRRAIEGRRLPAHAGAQDSQGGAQQAATAATEGGPPFRGARAHGGESHRLRDCETVLCLPV